MSLPTGSVVATGVLGQRAANAFSARRHGASEAMNLAALALKYAACAGASAESVPASARATAGIVAGAYQRCGLGVESGSRSSLCTSITLRDELGEAASMLFMKAS